MSNGHGEDLSGALLGKELKRIGHQVEALPFVGHGLAYQKSGINLLGQTREFSTGGLGYTTLLGRLTELVQGQVFYLIGRLLRLFFSSKQYDFLLVVGDVVPVVAAWLTGLPVFTYLVAYSSHYEGKLQLPWPCSHCLSSRRFLGVYSRDQLTALDLTNQLFRPVNFVGNPFMDTVLLPKPPLPQCSFRLGLLPGSRRPELDRNLLLLLRVLEFFPERKVVEESFSFDIALVSSLDDIALEELANSAGWQLIDSFGGLNHRELVRGDFRVMVHRDSFVEVLQSSNVLLSMAGTAAEQAVGLAKPVVQLSGYGPQFTSAFAEAQRRLLGPTVLCADGPTGEINTLKKTALLTLDMLERSMNDISLQRECSLQAERRIGIHGGTSAMVNACTNLI